jgi:hypothetical protein
MTDIEYVPVTDIEVGDKIFSAYKDEVFIVTDVEEVEDDWAGEKPIGLQTFIRITFDAEVTLKFHKDSSLWRFK